MSTAVLEVERRPRYLALLDALEKLVQDPPWRGRAHRAAARVLPRLVAREHERLEAQLGSATDLRGPDQDAALHEARKRAKRVRYACEVVAPSFLPEAKRLAKAVTVLQEAPACTGGPRNARDGPGGAGLSGIGPQCSAARHLGVGCRPYLSGRVRCDAVRRRRRGGTVSRSAHRTAAVRVRPVQVRL